MLLLIFRQEFPSIHEPRKIQGIRLEGVRAICEAPTPRGNDRRLFCLLLIVR